MASWRPFWRPAGQQASQQARLSRLVEFFRRNAPEDKIVEFSRARRSDRRVFSSSRAGSSSFLALAGQIVEFWVGSPDDPTPTLDKTRLKSWGLAQISLRNTILYCKTRLKSWGLAPGSLRNAILYYKTRLKSWGLAPGSLRIHLKFRALALGRFTRCG